MAPCTLSCAISAIFIIGMIYFYNRTDNNDFVKNYKSRLSPELQTKYDKIVSERLTITYQGYGLGVLIALCIIFYSLYIRHERLKTLPLICIVVSTCFITNYFYYSLYPKSDWLLNHMKNPEEIKNWLRLYKEMQYNYHMGLVFGIIAVGVFAFAFRC
jgi:hypothetical protein